LTVVGINEPMSSNSNGTSSPKDKVKVI
jgi:hypothetical protein